MRKNLFIFNFEQWPKACLLAIGVICGSYIVELWVLPINLATFRVWEALEVKKFGFALSGPFYPNMHLSMSEEGDLGHHTASAVQKRVEWHTDTYGFRADNTSSDWYPIVIVGDSLIAGSALTQADILSEVLGRSLRVGVYPFAPASIDTFLRNERFAAHPPDIVILESVEAEILRLPPLRPPPSHLRQLVKRYVVRYGQPIFVPLDRMSKSVLYHRIAAEIGRRRQNLTQWVLSTLKRSSVTQAPFASEPQMLFYKGVEANRGVSQEQIDGVVRRLKTYTDALSRRGIRLMFLPVPNKENIYCDLLSIRQKPLFLEQLTAALTREGIDVIDIQGAFDEARHHSRTFLYHLDDTHWNANGVRVAADVIAERLKRMGYKISNPTKRIAMVLNK